MRLAAYAGTSAILAAGALLKAFNERPNFYSATVYLSQSNACILILTNLALVCAVSFIYGLQRLLYGPLRTIEIEQLSEKAWYAVLDTLLAMPSLRDDVGGWLLSIFVLLLAAKVWGWIGEGRVDILEQQPPQNPILFHTRLSASLLLSVAFDSFMFNYCLKSVLEDPRPGMMVIFTFEFAILTIFSLFTACRYGLALAEARIVHLQTKVKIEERRKEIQREREQAREGSGETQPPIVVSADEVDENEIDVPGWEEKRRWLFALELATDFIKIIVYTIFFTISLTFIGLPMHIMRDVYLTFASFTKRLQDYSNYRKATHDMNTKYPDATAQELGNENTCIVCREAMVPWEDTQQPAAPGAPTRRPINEGLRAKKLPCGHILHLRCLKAWLERQQACPTCRRPVIPQSQSLAATVRGNARPGANVPFHPPAAGAQPGVPNPPNGAIQPPARRNRMRWLNMGPVRIGFYNGPANQVQEALRQQQGAPLVTGVRPSARLLNQTNQDHLRAVELRLLQQAHDLQIEQAQLGTVRALEAELVRLRAFHSSSRVDPATGAEATRSSLRNARPNPLVPSQLVPPPGLAPQLGFPGAAATLPQVFQQRQGQQPLSPGHGDLPEGLTLPEGWSALPLQRLGGQMPVVQPIPQAQAMMPFPFAFPSNMMAPMPSFGGLPDGTNVSVTPAAAQNPGVEAQLQSQSTSQASEQHPQHELPVFNPDTVTTESSQASQLSFSTQHTTGESPPPHESRVGSTATSTAPASVQPAHSSAPQSTAPWDTAGWSFGAPIESTTTSTQTDQGLDVQPSSDSHQPTANGNAPATVDTQQGEPPQVHESGAAVEERTDKGKGRAVEVEDVPDSEI